MSFQNLPAGTVLKQGQAFQVEFTFTSPAGFDPDPSLLQQVIDTSASVVPNSTTLTQDISGVWFYNGQIQDNGGYTAGQLKADIYAGLSAYSSTESVGPLQNFRVSDVQVDVPSGIGNAAAIVWETTPLGSLQHIGQAPPTLATAVNEAAAKNSPSLSTRAIIILALVAVIGLVALGFSTELGLGRLVGGNRA